jgi:hypothetical protein
MTVGDPGEDVGQIAKRIDFVELQGSIREATVA